MQPIPAPITARLLGDAAVAFNSAAQALPGGREQLQAGASSVTQALPSVRMTLTGDVRTYLMNGLKEAADGARALSTTLADPAAKIDLPAVRQQVLGWSQIADSAAAHLESPPL